MIKTKRHTKTAKPNRIIIPFVAYNATTGTNRPTRLNAREIGDCFVRVFFKLENNLVFYLLP